MDTQQQLLRHDLAYNSFSVIFVDFFFATCKSRLSKLWWGNRIAHMFSSIYSHSCILIHIILFALDIFSGGVLNSILGAINCNKYSDAPLEHSGTKSQLDSFGEKQNKTTQTKMFLFSLNSGCDMPWRWVCGRRDCGWSVDSDVFYRHGMASNQRNYLGPFPWELPFVLDFWGLLAFLYPFVLFSSLRLCVRLCLHSFCLLIVYTQLYTLDATLFFFVFFSFCLRSPNEINNRMPRMPVWCASSTPIRLFLLLVSFLTKRKNKKKIKNIFIYFKFNTQSPAGRFPLIFKMGKTLGTPQAAEMETFLSPNFFIYRGVLTSCWWAMSSSYDLAHDWMGNPWLCFEDRESVR